MRFGLAARKRAGGSSPAALWAMAVRMDVFLPNGCAGMTYRIRDWDANFENNKSRERERCSFVCVPNKMGLGLSHLLTMPNGVEAYAIFVLIAAQICSSQGLPREGYLTEDGTQSGRALDTFDISTKLRIANDKVVTALELLSNPKVNWIQALQSECPPSARPVPDMCPPSARPVPLNGREEKRREEKRSIRGTPPKPPVGGYAKKRNPLIAAINAVGGKIRGRKAPRLIEPNIVHKLVRDGYVNQIGSIAIASAKGANGSFVLVVGADGKDHQIQASTLKPENLHLAASRVA